MITEQWIREHSTEQSFARGQNYYHMAQSSIHHGAEIPWKGTVKAQRAVPIIFAWS
jgi:hypothetical protein